MAVTIRTRVEREEEARDRRPRTVVLRARPSGKKADAKTFYGELKRRYPNVIKYLAEH